jgi:Tol biopolymer transport system component
MDLNGNNWVDITAPNTFGIAEFGLHFSPDGTKIIFLTTEYLGYNNGSDIVIADIDGSNWVNISNAVGPNYYYFPFWHPTNNTIYYCFNIDGYQEWYIYSMSTTGTNQTLLSNCSLVGNEELTQNKDLLVYPNPASSQLNIGNIVYDRAVISDLSGRSMGEFHGDIIDVTFLNKGIYTIRLYDNQNVILTTEKFIKE